ncbi:heavy metal translocating P-type ATPase [Alteromonas macleodii]|uniref:Copper/silver-translocating P-type ATPase n=1 Tax=Alteromonas macleodii TaxID=28108 RepID=A0A6T9XZ34_ALTMA|nr:heavy metal translocating P-type ATPase [Alteromonas macleodii]CAB9494075.1 Copper/silver-translocating P-type ATPase [Alteromonas macleodii]
MTKHDCYHCGLPVAAADDGKFTTVILGQHRDMCCPGCLAVAEAIVNNGLEDYYQFRTEPAQKSDDGILETLDKLKVYDDPSLQEEFVFEEGQDKQIQLTLEGITCAACGWLIEKQLSKVEGIKQVAVNVQERRALVTWSPFQIKLSQILSTLKRIGYIGSPFHPDEHEASYKREQKTFLKKLGLAGIMTMQVMMLMTGLYFDWFGAIELETRQYFYWVALTLTTPVVLYSGSTFYVGAAKALSARTVNMDVPVTLAIFGTYIAGIRSTMLEQGEVYFESICMFIFLLLLSRFLEHRSRHRAAQISANMMQYVPVSATKLMPDGSVTECLAKQLKVNDVVLVKPGETIPIDGLVTEGNAAVDESMLTGEFNPVRKTNNSVVYGGTVCQDGSLTITVTQTLKNALVNQIVRLQASAMASKPKAAQIADNFSRYFVTAVLLISALTYTFWAYNGSVDAFWITISVLVATCPCALGLATPSALTCAMAKLNRQGILLKRADALEQITGIDTIALDKTGTLTQGKFTISNAWYADGVDSDSAFSIARALESRSEHPIAKAFSGDKAFSDNKAVSGDKTSNGNTIHKVSNFTVTPGGGISGEINDTLFCMGSAAFSVHESQQSFIEGYPSANVFLTVKGRIMAAFEVRDSLRDDTQETLDILAKSHTLAVLSGDTQQNVDSLTKPLPISTAKGGLTPEQKYETVQAMQQSGSKVMMMGDGINDAPVLASADVAIAVGNATDVAKTAADVILLGDQLLSVPELIKTSHQVKQKIRQNIGWSLGYNVLILPFAVTGLLSPWMAVVGMSLSSIIVVTNSTRLLGK